MTLETPNNELFHRITTASMKSVLPFFVMASVALAQTPTPHSPTAFIGKTYEECEKVLGTPVKSSTPADGGRPVFSREYKSPVPGITRIELVRMPEGGISNPPPETVNSVKYYFPKGEQKTLKSMFSLLGVTTGTGTISISGLSREAIKAAVESRNMKLLQAGWDDPLPADGQTSRSVSGIAGGLAASLTPAANSLKMSPRYQHPGEDALLIYRNQEAAKLAAPPPPLTAHDSPELRQNGAFGFSQATAKILRDSKEARFSAWSNPEWLYVQIVVWADDDDALGTMAGTTTSDTSILALDLNADQQDTPQVDRKYHLNPIPMLRPQPPLLRGLYYQIYTENNPRPPLASDSKGRGSIQYVRAADGKKIRVDSFLIPLTELGRKAGDKIRLILSGESVAPNFGFNSGGLSTNGRPRFYTSMPKQTYHEFTLGEQTGTINPALVPDGRSK